MENEKGGGSVYNGDEEEQEDQKMEQFFALIKSFREARNRRKNELEEKEKKKKIRRSNEEQPSWVPSFEWEDFTEEIQFRRPPVIFPSPCNKKEDQNQEEDDHGLDLKLAL